MNSQRIVALMIIVLASPIAMAYEFSAGSGGVAEWSTYGTSAYERSAAGGTGSAHRRVSTTVKPEECRLYLTYADEGVGHQALLEGAKEVGQHLEETLADLGRERVKIESANYSPEKSLGGMFRKERDEIGVVFRITIMLNTEDKNAFWDNAQLVASVLDKVGQVKIDGRWGKKLREGRVAYAVQSIGSTRRSLLAMVNEEVEAMKDSFAAANEVNTSDVLCAIDYGVIYSESPTLEAVEVFLPYGVNLELKEIGVAP